VPPFGRSTQFRKFVVPDLLEYDGVNEFVWAAAGTWNDNFGAAPVGIIFLGIIQILPLSACLIANSIFASNFYMPMHEATYKNI